MAAINEEQFNRPEALKEAEGHQFSKPIHTHGGDVYSVGGMLNGGLIKPAGLTVLPGNKLFRFGNAHHLVDKTSYGCWWIDWPAFRQVEEFAKDQRLTIANAISKLCAVPSEWGNTMTLMVQAEVRYPLLAYRGLGREVRTKTGDVFDPAMHGQDVFQLFIPGLNEPDLSKKALKLTTYDLMPQDFSRK